MLASQPVGRWLPVIRARAEWLRRGPPGWCLARKYPLWTEGQTARLAPGSGDADRCLGHEAAATPRFPATNSDHRNRARARLTPSPITTHIEASRQSLPVT